MTPLYSLVSLLPFLAILADAGSSHGHRARARSMRDHLVYIERSAPAVNPSLALEERLAKRAQGKILANRAANATQCRARGSKFVASVSVSSSSTASSSKTTSSSSAAATASVTTSATPSTATSNNNNNSGGGSATSNVAYGSLTPNGIKAGIAGGDAFPWLQNHIGWWYDWSANPGGWGGSPVAVPMLWGAGTADGADASRLGAFQGMNWNPPYIIGFEEPDCPAGSGSAGFDVATGVALWNSLVVPHQRAGSLAISPSMCHQAAETGWLQPFQQGISQMWDITNVHINKNSLQGIQDDLNHYWNTYGKPMWITEFACVDDNNGFAPCTDQGQINNFIWTAVQTFESDSRVAGYAYSNGYGLGDVWPLVSNGKLSASGETYLAAISQYH